MSCIGNKKCFFLLYIDLSFVSSTLVNSFQSFLVTVRLFRSWSSPRKDPARKFMPYLLKGIFVCSTSAYRLLGVLRILPLFSEEKRKKRSTTNIINRQHMVYKTKRIKLMSFRMLQHALSIGNVCNGGYSLKWPIRGGSARKEYLLQALGI